MVREPSGTTITGVVPTGAYACRDGRHVVVSVTDRGPGVGEQAEAQLFHPFFTTKPDGMGMGLSISHSIVMAHEGTLSYERNPDGGAIFRFTLPVETGRGKR